MQRAHSIAQCDLINIIMDAIKSKLNQTQNVRYVDVNMRRHIMFYTMGGVVLERIVWTLRSTTMQYVCAWQLISIVREEKIFCSHRTSASSQSRLLIKRTTNHYNYTSKNISICTLGISSASSIEYCIYNTYILAGRSFSAAAMYDSRVGSTNGLCATIHRRCMSMSITEV